MSEGYEQHPFDEGFCVDVEHNDSVFWGEDICWPYFKSEAWFNFNPAAICYVPEAAFEEAHEGGYVREEGGESKYYIDVDVCYTREDFMELCDGNYEMAKALFGVCEGYSPETYVADGSFLESWLNMNVGVETDKDEVAKRIAAKTEQAAQLYGTHERCGKAAEQEI